MHTYKAVCQIPPRLRIAYGRSTAHRSMVDVLLTLSAVKITLLIQQGYTLPISGPHLRLVNFHVSKTCDSKPFGQTKESHNQPCEDGPLIGSDLFVAGAFQLTPIHSTDPSNPAALWSKLSTSYHHRPRDLVFPSFSRGFF